MTRDNLAASGTDLSVGNDIHPAHAAGPVSGAAAVLHADGSLPGRNTAYALRSGQGEHHLVGGQVATVLARSVDTGGLHEAVILTGGRGAHLPLRRHARTDVAFYVLDGSVEFWLDGRSHLLSRGDYAFVPAGTAHAHRMLDWRTRLLSWSTGELPATLYPALGHPFTRPVQPEQADPSIDPSRLRAAEAAADVQFLPPQADHGSPQRPDNEIVPDERVPYVLVNGGGERRVAAEQMFTFLQTQASTDGAFITVMNEGPAGEAIPPHFHREHTENFFCLDGHMTMWINGQELKLLPGDYLQVPPLHVHAYRLDAPYTRFLGWLTPGLFEPFFRHLGDAYDGHVFPLVPPPFRFDRVLAHLPELDLQPMGRP